MPKFYYLTEQDRERLDRLFRMFFGSGPSPNSKYPEDNIPKSPDVYIALVPPEGIPAATNNAGTSVPDFTAGDKPGSAECEIYRIVGDELVLMNFEKTVYNLTVSVIPESWISVKRDKTGSWIADTGSPCTSRNEKWLISLMGPPDEGTFDIHIPINGVDEPLTFDYDMTALQVKETLETHTELIAGDVETEGGPWPDSSINVEFKGGQEGKSIIPTRIDKTNLTSTGDKVIDVAIHRWIPGFPD